MQRQKFLALLGGVAAIGHEIPAGLVLRADKPVE